eukprot:m.46167 g.46167  ORF g.46167 m.46167 type:complete len:130 (-) comp12228_c0_seq1:899-1288(-)
MNEAQGRKNQTNKEKEKRNKREVIVRSRTPVCWPLLKRRLASYLHESDNKFILRPDKMGQATSNHLDAFDLLLKPLLEWVIHFTGQTKSQGGDTREDVKTLDKWDGVHKMLVFPPAGCVDAQALPPPQG